MGERVPRVYALGVAYAQSRKNVQNLIWLQHGESRVSIGNGYEKVAVRFVAFGVWLRSGSASNANNSYNVNNNGDWNNNNVNNYNNAARAD